MWQCDYNSCYWNLELKYLIIYCQSYLYLIIFFFFGRTWLIDYIDTQERIYIKKDYAASCSNACARVRRYTCTSNVLCTTTFSISLGWKLYVLLEKLCVSERGCSNLGGRLCIDSCLAVLIILRVHKMYFLNL